jgi:hypothetical protein
MAEDGVSLREYVEAIMREQAKRMEDARDTLDRRLDESSRDRERIRESIGKLVPREEHDRTQGQNERRLAALERTSNRLYGVFALVPILVGVVGVLLGKYVG